VFESPRLLTQRDEHPSPIRETPPSRNLLAVAPSNFCRSQDFFNRRETRLRCLFTAALSHR